MYSLDDDLHVEIVQVVRTGHLIDYDGVESKFSPDSGQATAPGYYVAIWPYLMVDEPRFTDPHLRFFGPYDLAIFARLKMSKHVEEFIRLRSATVVGRIATTNVHGAQPGR